MNCELIPPLQARPGAYRRDFEQAAIVVPFRLATDRGTLSFFSTTTIFGTPVDVTLSELAIEAFFPADDATGATLYQRARGLAAQAG